MNDYSTYEKRLAEIRMKGMALRAEELRFKGQKRKKNGQIDFDDSIRSIKNPKTH